MGIWQRIRLGATVALIGWFSVLVMAQTPPTALPNLEPRFREGMQLEQLRLLPQARGQYLDVARQFVRLAETTKSKDVVLPQLPAVLGSVYRLGIVTARDNYVNPHPLVYQLDTFQETQTVLDQVLIVMGELRRTYPTQVSRGMYDSLYFARAYNRIAWANKLLIGSAWKNYLVAPPADLVGMMTMAVADLDQLLLLQDLPPSIKNLPPGDDPYAVLNDRFFTRFSALPRDSLEYRALRMINFEDDPTHLSRLTTKRTLNQVYGTLEFYNSAATQAVLNAAKSSYTLDRLVSKESQPLFKTFDQFVSLIGVL